MSSKTKRYLAWLLTAGAVVAALLVGRRAWQRQLATRPPAGIVTGNGRLEAIRIDVSSKFAGRVAEVLVQEGDRVEAGQVVARMDTLALQAQVAEAQAQVVNALASKPTVQATVTERLYGLSSVKADLVQRESDLLLAQQTFDRSAALFAKGAIPRQQLEADQGKLAGEKALVASQKSKVGQAQAEIAIAKSQVDAARASIEVASAVLERLKTDLADANLKAPRAGRIQHRLVQSGEVVTAGAKIVTLIDLSQVYMTVFLPEGAAGKLEMGAEGRLVLDALPQYVFPAKVSYVASDAQFTPKTVETSTEREKLAFDVRLRLDAADVAKYQPLIKVGLPGVVHVRVDPAIDWPASLAVKLPIAPIAQP